MDEKGCSRKEESRLFLKETKRTTLEKCTDFRGLNLQCPVEATIKEEEEDEDDDDYDNNNNEDPVRALEEFCIANELSLPTYRIISVQCAVCVVKFYLKRKWINLSSKIDDTTIKLLWIFLSPIQCVVHVMLSYSLRLSDSCIKWSVVVSSTFIYVAIKFYNCQMLLILKKK